MSKKIILPVLALASFALTSCGSSTGGLDGKSYKLDMNEAVVFNFQNGLTENAFFGPDSEFNAHPEKAAIVNDIDEAMRYNSRELLDHMEFSKETHLKDYFDMNVREYDGVISINNIFYRAKNGYAEFVMERDGVVKTASWGLTSQKKRDTIHGIDYCSKDEITLNSAKIFDNKLVFDVKYDFYETNFDETQMKREAHATFNLTWNKI